MLFRSKVHTLKEIVTYYNKKGDPVEIIERINGVFSQKILYSYNKNGDEKTNCHIDSLGNVIDIKTFYYDTFGNSLGYSLENANHEKQEELVIELNKFNDKISESIFDANHILKTKTIFVYDNKGLLTEKKTYNGNNELIYWKITNYE